ncbi:MAG TPA: hypothetical protein VNC16_05310 [Solirubrobacterales bacterium]|jgi:hypothetical protein|nr:hypothetical protein [Solirubrobacterales bacterium]
MHRKILAICSALVALGAFAMVPAMASAVTLKHGATTLATGTKITALNEEHALFVAGGTTVTCNENWMTGTVHANTGGTGANSLMGTISAASFNNAGGKDCTSGLGEVKVKIPTLEAGKHWCISNTKTADEWQLQGGACTGAVEQLKFVLTFTSILGAEVTCEYGSEESKPVTGSFTTGTAPATLKVEKEPPFIRLNANGLCPETGKITKMAFNLYTDNLNKEGLTITNP